jgi:hypothetical protein
VFRGTHGYGAGMTVPPPGRDRPEDERPPSWMGAPGYTPYADGLPPHAPMPGAPPYPQAPEQSPPPIGQPPPGTRFRAALGAAAAWAAVNLVLVLLVLGPPGNARVLGAFLGALVVTTVLAALIVWLIARRRGWPFWLLALLAAPVFWVLRALANLPVT